jgi:low temperature requirement protein LtrA
MPEKRTTPDPPHPAPAKPWWRRPELRRDEEEGKEHKTSALELFLDLVFAVVIDNLTHVLSQQISWTTVAEFCMLFIPVWWTWMGCTYYNDRFETNDVSHRLFTFLTMLPLVGMAYSAGARRPNLDYDSDLFIWSYVAARIVLIGMWVRAGWHSPEAQPLTLRYQVGFSASVVFWAVSAFVPLPWRYLLWGAGLLIDLLTPLTTLRIQAGLPRLSTSHLPERFGTITLIVLGECVACVVQGPVNNPHKLTPTGAAQCALGLALCFSLWWIYFDHVMGRRSRPGAGWTSAWAYAHLPLLAALTSVSVAVRALGASENDALSEPVRWLACGGMTVVLVALGVIEWTLTKDRHASIRLLRVEALRFAAAAAVLLLGLFGGALNTIVLLAMLVGLAVALVIDGLCYPTQRPGAQHEPDAV